MCILKKIGGLKTHTYYYITLMILIGELYY